MDPAAAAAERELTVVRGDAGVGRIIQLACKDASEPLVWLDLSTLAPRNAVEAPGAPRMAGAFVVRVKHTDFFTDRRFRFVVDKEEGEEDENSPFAEDNAMVFVQPARDTLQSQPLRDGVRLLPVGRRGSILPSSIQSRRGMIVFAGNGAMLDASSRDRMDNPNEFEDDFEDDYQIVFQIGPRLGGVHVRRNDLRHLYLSNAATQAAINSVVDLRVYRLVITYNSSVVIGNLRYTLERTDPAKTLFGLSQPYEKVDDLTRPLATVEPIIEKGKEDKEDEEEEEEEDDEDDGEIIVRRRSVGYLSGYTAPSASKRRRNMPNTI